jgi:hypothetical protein
VALDVVGEVCKADLRAGTGDSHGAGGELHPRLPLGDDVLHLGPRR